jgi:hypothetical protein
MRVDDFSIDLKLTLKSGVLMPNFRIIDNDTVVDRDDIIFDNWLIIIIKAVRAISFHARVADKDEWRGWLRYPRVKLLAEGRVFN